MKKANKTNAKRYYYKLPGATYAHGPTEPGKYTSKAQVREMLRRSWYGGAKRLPNGIEIWEA